MAVLLLLVIRMTIRCKCTIVIINWKIEIQKNKTRFRSRHHECCEESPSPDDPIFKYLATIYSDNHPVMRNGHECNETFPGGITNGAFWYELNGKLIIS